MHQQLACFLLCQLFSVCVFIAPAQTRLPVVFGSNMVLQQQQQVRIWGSDRPGAVVKVTGSWGKTAQARTDATGRWRLLLQTPAAGGPYTVTVAGSSMVLLQHILIGEVWLCSGQSNVEMPVKGKVNQPVVGSNEAILNSGNDEVRMFTQQKLVSSTPSDSSSGQWYAAGPATTGDFSAVAYFFAKKLQAVLHVPVGIIHTSWGASTVESWMDRETLSGFPGDTVPEQFARPNANKTPTALFNSMLHPFIGYTIRGMLWYQGEGNRLNAGEYQAKFSALIQSWRDKWNQGEFPFYFVQIAPFAYPGSNAAYLREAQLRTMQSVKATGMAVTLDVGEEKCIHPAQKEPVGNRLAYWALAKDYGVPGIAYSGPVYKAMQTSPGGKVLLQFDHAGMGLTSFRKPLDGFEIAGADQVFYPAQASISNNENNRGVTVWSEQVADPKSVRYAFSSWVTGSLFNTEGLPASSFRTDNW